ncbi:DNA-binding protein [Streptomyces sp. NPDC046909]|uniref:nSTAND1 domain-containing NTPase n=1 Tax=Streptomyces sp. NPDC046909 TaxID=3155617 RepID=UPI0033DA3B61
MGRRERPVDPVAGPVQEFAHGLRELRRAAGGPTYRELARRASYSVSALSQAAAGDQLPSLAVTLAYVRACDGDAEEWERRWRKAAGSAREDDGDEAPYQGLARYEPGDHERFFGRDALVADLCERVRGGRFTAVFGPSGSGKSSLLRAGLIPALRTGGVGDGPALAAIRVLTPGPHPLRAHAEALRAKEGPGDTLLVVDQFEEVFTLCQDPAERAGFIDQLLDARRPGGRLRVVIAVRADFYGRCAEHRALAEALTGTGTGTGAGAGAGVLVGPMSAAELREVVVRPARSAGLLVERELTELLVREAAGEPGGLPLLSHVLRETWRRRRGRTLTVEAYEAAGGLRGALARTAEDVYTRLPEEQAVPARLLLLRLITPGEHAQDTRRPLGRGELDFARDADLAPVLDRLARARLVTLDDDTVDLAHEALITGWPRLSGWIDEHRERLRAHRGLTEAAGTWRDLGREPGALYRGARLAAAETQLDERELTSLEREFLVASRSARARDSRRRRLLTSVLATLVALALVAGAVAWQQGRTSERRAVQAEARRIAALADGVRFTDPVTAMRLSVAAWRLADTTETRSALLAALYRPEQDVLAVPEADTRTDSQSGSGSGPESEEDAEEDSLSERHLSPDGRTLVSVTKDRVVIWDVRTHRRTHTYPGLGDAAPDTFGTVLAPDGRSLVLLGESTRLWDLRTGRVTARFDGNGIDAVFGASGRTLAVAETDDGAPGVPVSEEGASASSAGAPADSAEASADASEDSDTDGSDTDGSDTDDSPLLRVWDVHRHRELLRLSRDGGDYAEALAVSPDDRLLAVCSDRHPLRVWDLTRGRRLSLPGVGNLPSGTCAEGGGGLAFAPDGRTLALATGSGIRLWDARAGTELAPLTGGGTGLRELRFSADGRFVTAARDDRLLMWRLASPTAPVLRHTLTGESAAEVRLDPADGVLRYLDAPGTAVRSLSLGQATTGRWQNYGTQLARFSQDGRLLALLRSTDLDDPGGYRLLDAGTGRTVAALPGTPCTDMNDEDPQAGWELPDSDADAALAVGQRMVSGGGDPGPGAVETCVGNSMAFSADGRYLAYTLDEPWRIQVRDLRTGRTHATVSLPKASLGQVHAIALSADGRRLVLSYASDQASRSVQVWDLARAGRATRAKTLPGLYGAALALRPGPGTLVTWHGIVADPAPGTSARTTRRTLSAYPVSALAFSADGAYLAVGDTLGRVTVWDGELRSRVAVLPGTRIADSGTESGGDGGNAGDMGDQDGSGGSGGSAGVSALAFSADGHTLAVAGASGTVRLWDVPGNQPLGSALPTPGDPVLALAWSPDGRTLRTSGLHSTLQSYGTDAGDLVERVCARAGGGLDRAAWRTYLPDVPYRRTCDGS